MSVHPSVGGASSLTAPAPPTPYATELECERTIIEAATVAGWRVHGERPARSNRGWRTPIKGHPGFPDLVLSHPVAGTLFVELKSRRGTLTDDQAAWAETLTRAGSHYRLVRVPDELVTFCQELADMATRGPRSNRDRRR